MITDEEKQLIETLKRSFTRMEAFYKAKSTRIRVYEEKISQLESENAALRERLRKAVKDVAERIENALFREFADDMTFKMASRIEEVIKAELKGGDHE